MIVQIQCGNRRSWIWLRAKQVWINGMIFIDRVWHLDTNLLGNVLGHTSCWACASPHGNEKSWRSTQTPLCRHPAAEWPKRVDQKARTRERWKQLLAHLVVKNEKWRVQIRFQAILANKMHLVKGRKKNNVMVWVVIECFRRPLIEKKKKYSFSILFLKKMNKFMSVFITHSWGHHLRP